VQAAFCYVIPEEEAAPIQAIRRELDPAFARWPAHINILFPFVDQARFAEVQPVIVEALRDVDSFEFTAERFERFKGGNIHLKVESPGFKKIYDKVVAALPECASHRPFCAHLTVAKLQKAKDKEMTAKIEELQATWKPVTFQVDRMSLLKRDADTPFAVADQVALRPRHGGAGVGGLDARAWPGLGEAEKEGTDAPRPPAKKKRWAKVLP